jgi:hypothetical protein
MSQEFLNFENLFKDEDIFIGKIFLQHSIRANFYYKKKKNSREICVT